MCPFSSNPFIVVIPMTNRRSVARIVEEDIANAGDPPQESQDPPQGNQAHPQEQVHLGDQASINLHAMMDGEIRSIFLCLAQAMTT